MARADCKSCGGTGWIVADHDGIPAADRCACVAESASEALEEHAQIPKNYRHVSLKEQLILPQDNPIEKQILSEAMLRVLGYARQFPALTKPGLLLIGPPGVGKTHLAVAVLRDLMSRGHEGLFFDYQNLLERIRAGYNENLGMSSREAYRSALDAEILLLDDLGAHRVTDWVEDTVTSIITYRYNHRKPLIATTNLEDPDLGSAKREKSGSGMQNFRTTLEQRVGERARSRLFEMCEIVSMWGVSDYRFKKLR